jgi:1,4-alpha-glucan branching enzyme
MEIIAEKNIGFKKHYLKTRPVCKVTFRLPMEAAPGAKKVTVVGDFNDWDRESNPMRKLKDGSFTLTIEFEKGRDYRFRYLVDGTRWANDWRADRYVKNPYGGDDSVVDV